jgi:hypothetical protein
MSLCKYACMALESCLVLSTSLSSLMPPVRSILPTRWSSLVLVIREKKREIYI